ncbi:hypothetical protein MCANUFG4_02610 [Mycoplasmopsis canis UFG4]|uniref:Uncharacterized protein n=1 Tax=Mycoplasmopsis canis UFG4 TaxID=1131455 RepID=I1A4C8_9BACT|nr:hypothetical protein MCANUFG4_02610 [Mycoplasmopsis canis UFG4]
MSLEKKYQKNLFIFIVKEKEFQTLVETHFLKKWNKSIFSNFLNKKQHTKSKLGLKISMIIKYFSLLNRKLLFIIDSIIRFL